MFSKIQGQVSIIGDKAVSEAIMPYYPLESDIIIDLTQVEDVTSAQKQIERAVDLHIKSNSNEESYSVFIMAKIPYACYLGYALGNKVKSVSHQFLETPKIGSGGMENLGIFMYQNLKWKKQKMK